MGLEDTAQPFPTLRVAQLEQRQGGPGNLDSVLFHSKSQGLRRGRQGEPGGTQQIGGLGWNPSPTAQAEAAM